MKHPIEGNPIHFTLNVDTEEAEAQLARLQAKITAMEEHFARVLRLQTVPLLRVPENNGVTTPLLCAAAATTVVAGAKLSRRQLLGLAWRRRG